MFVPIPAPAELPPARPKVRFIIFVAAATSSGMVGTDPSAASAAALLISEVRPMTRKATTGSNKAKTIGTRRRDRVMRGGRRVGSIWTERLLLQIDSTYRHGGEYRP